LANKSSLGKYFFATTAAAGTLVLTHESIDLPIVGQHLLMKLAELAVERVKRLPGERRQVSVMPLADDRPAVLERIGPLGDDDTELDEKASQSIDQARVLGDAGLAEPVHEENRLLIDQNISSLRANYRERRSEFTEDAIFFLRSLDSVHCESPFTVSIENAGTQTVTYSAPSGVL